jgi:hypothetical protein
MRARTLLPSALVFSFTQACACGQVASEDEARIAYLGIDQIVSKTLALGFAGFRAANSANIPTQTDDGDDSGSITVTGQVDQGSSDNKGMRLEVALDEYSDGTIDDPESEGDDQIAIVYATAEDAPLVVVLDLRNFPDGTLEGSLSGVIGMSGNLEGDLELIITLSGEIEEDGAGTGDTRRVEGSTNVTGTAESANGTFDIDTTL